MNAVLYIDENPELTRAFDEVGIGYIKVNSSQLTFLNKDNKEKIFVDGEEINLDEFSGVVFLPSESNNFSLSTFLTSNKVKGIYNTMDSIHRAKNKFWSYQDFKGAGLRMPTTVCINPYKLKQEALDKILKENFNKEIYLVKPNDASWGYGVFLSCGAKEILTRIRLDRNLPKSKVWFIQDYISPNKRIDERHMVFNNEVVSSAYKIGAEGKIATNIYLGGKWGVMPEIDDETREMCVKATNAVGLTYSGVDIIRDENGTPYLLEINDSPSHSICAGVGKNHYFKLTDYILQNWDK